MKFNQDSSTKINKNNKTKQNTKMEDFQQELKKKNIHKILIWRQDKAMSLSNGCL